MTERAALGRRAAATVIGIVLLVLIGLVSVIPIAVYLVAPFFADPPSCVDEQSAILVTGCSSPRKEGR